MPSGVVDVGIGRATAFAIKRESDWGVVTQTGTNDWHFLPQTGNDLNGDIEQLEDDTIIGSRARQPSLAGTDEITGGLDLTTDPDLIGFPLFYTLGETVASSGSNGDWTHSFWPTDLADIQNRLPSYSVMRKLDKFNIRMRGGKIDSFNFDQGLGDVTTTSVDVQTRDEEKPPDSEVPATPNIDTSPFKFRDGSIKTDIDGSLQGVAEIQDISFDIANNLEADPTINSGQFMGYLVAMGREISGSMTITYEDSTFYDAFQNGQQFEVEVQFDSESETAGSSSNSQFLKFRFPRAKFTNAPIDVGGGDEVLTQSTDFRADFDAQATQTLADGSTLTGFDVYAELLNSTPSGTYQN